MEVLSFELSNQRSAVSLLAFSLLLPTPHSRLPTPSFQSLLAFSLFLPPALYL
ncbi:MAG: hypothetical protein ACAF41_10850 [Leptolyngbya sp. BL-A-14]